jgi:5-amino-6-(5-phosphoribosylamino)uracil reductase
MNRWRDAFSEFAERKTRAATTAVLPPYITVCASPEASLVGLGNAWSASRFDGPFYVTAPAPHGRPVCSLVFVQSADGNTVADDPTTLGGGETDKHLVYEGLSRVAADAVLAGANSVRSGKIVLSVWHPELVSLRAAMGLPRHPVQVVATWRGIDLESSLLFNVEDVQVILLTGPSGAARMATSAAARPWVRVITMERPDCLAQALESLRTLHIDRVSCIGGRTLATALLDLRLIDDVYLTTAPGPGGEPGTPMYAGQLSGSVVVRKRGTAEESGVLFEHIHLPATHNAARRSQLAGRRSQ